MNITIKQDPSADWTSRNPVLEQFCLGYETDTGKAKMGDGVTAWSSLGYFAPSGASAGASQCLYFDSALGQHVNHGYFWKRTVSHGSFFWEAWVNASTGAEYIISDGYGGSHNLLFGLSGAAPCSPAGNLYSSGTVSFGSQDTFAAGEWHHVAVGWNGSYIITYVDGVPSLLTAFSGVRQSSGDASDGVLFVGGSTHSNYKGFIRCIRGFEGTLPLSSAFGAFRPDAYFTAAFDNGGNVLGASFVADYTIPGNVIADLSSGYLGTVHPGSLRDGNDTSTGGFGGGYVATAANLPEWEAIAFTEPTYGGSVTATPVGAIVFDAFERTNVTYAWGNSLGLGTAPTGQSWTAANWGILGTYGFSAINSSACKAVIDSAVTDQDVRMERKSNITATSVIVRYTDDNNFVRVDPDISGQIAIIEYVDGTPNVLKSGGTFGNSWTTLRVTAVGSNILVYVDDAVTHTAATTAVTSGTKVGMESQVPYYRVKSFTAYAG